jgi:hypothetical protein
MQSALETTIKNQKSTNVEKFIEESAQDSRLLSHATNNVLLKIHGKATKNRPNVAILVRKRGY